MGLAYTVARPGGGALVVPDGLDYFLLSGPELSAQSFVDPPHRIDRGTRFQLLALLLCERDQSFISLVFKHQVNPRLHGPGLLAAAVLA